MNPVAGLIAFGLSTASERKSAPAAFWMILYCLRLPSQRGLAPASGLKMTMYTWFRYAPCAFRLTGRLADTKTLLIACTSLRMSRIDWRTSAAFVAAKYLPPPTWAALFMRLIICWSLLPMLPLLPGWYTAIVYVITF